VNYFFFILRFIMRAFFVFAALAALAFASSKLKLDFEAGANLTGAEADFSFRYQSNDHFGFDVGVFSLDVLTWSSVSVDAKAANSSAKASADVMLGAGMLPTKATVPFSIFAYGSGEAAISVDLDTFFKSLLNQISGKLDANFAGGVIAMAALGMQEYDPDNKPVGDFIPYMVPLLSSCSADGIEGDDKNLMGRTCTFSPSDCSADVTVTFVTSKKAGILEYGETPVSPRSFEMIVEVEDFPLSDKNNHVRMEVALLTAKGAGEVKGNADVVRRPGKEDLYVAASTHAIVDGKRKEVNVYVDGKTEGEFGAVASAALSVALGSKDFSFNIAHVDFPAGATSFVYDPVVGAGSNVYDAEGASSVALSLLVALVCVLVYLF